MDASRGIINSCIFAGNLAFALFAFCFAFVIGATELPELIMFAGVCSFTGVFLSYGATVAIVAVFGHSAFPHRVAACVSGIAIAFCLFCVSFGVMGGLDLIATHFVGGIIVAVLWLALLQNIFGWRIQPKVSKLFLKPTGQFELRLLFYWTVGFAVLFTLLRRSNVTLPSIFGAVTTAVFTSTTVLAIVASIIRPRRNIIWMLGALMLVVVAVVIEVFVLKTLIPKTVPAVYFVVIVASTNAGLVVAAIAVGLSLRDLRLRSEDLSYEKLLATIPYGYPQLLLNTRNALEDFVNSPPCEILEHPAVTLNPLKAHQKHARGGVAASALFEIMLIMAIRARIDELLLRNTKGGCRVIHKCGETTYDVVPMPKHLTGRAINYYREIFGVHYPETQRKGILTLSGKSSVVVHFEILGGSRIGQARFTFSENKITDNECSEVVDKYFRAVRNETPFSKRLWYDLERLWYDIRNWAWPEQLRLQ